MRFQPSDYSFFGGAPPSAPNQWMARVYRPPPDNAEPSLEPIEGVPQREEYPSPWKSAGLGVVAQGVEYLQSVDAPETRPDSPVLEALLFATHIALGLCLVHSVVWTAKTVAISIQNDLRRRGRQAWSPAPTPAPGASQ